MEQLLEQYQLESLIIILILGVLFCFWGYKLLRIVTVVAAFLISAYLINHYLTSDVIIVLLAGIIGALASIFLFKVGVFLTGSLLGILLGISLGSPTEKLSSEMVIVILSIIGGGLALWIEKFIIILSTSILGASGIVFSIYILATEKTKEFQRINITYLNEYHYLVIVILAIFGLLFQYRKIKNIKRSIRERSFKSMMLSKDDLFAKYK